MMVILVADGVGDVDNDGVRSGGGGGGWWLWWWLLMVVIVVVVTMWMLYG